MKRTAVLVTFAISVCALTAAQAGVRQNAFEVALRGGIQSGDGETDVATDPTFGVVVAYALSPKLMVAFSYDQFGTTRDYTGVAGDPAQPVTQVRFSRAADTVFRYYSAGLTANFLTERDVKTTPFLSVGVGVVEEERDGAFFCVDLRAGDSTTCSNVRPNGLPVIPGSSIDPDRVDWQRFLDDKDTGTTITLAVGGRTFLSPWFGVTYELRYYHLDTFNVNQDAFQGAVGATFVFGGKK